jgi:hypothetical protein
MHRLSPAISLLLAIGLIGPSTSANGQDRARPAGAQSLIRGDQRVVVAMIDGFGTDYLETSATECLHLSSSKIPRCGEIASIYENISDYSRSPWA